MRAIPFWELRRCSSTKFRFIDCQLEYRFVNPEQLEKNKKRLRSRVPLLAKWLRRRAALNLAKAETSEAALLLAEVLARDYDIELQSIAFKALRETRSPECIDAACRVWMESRNQRLEEILVARHWVASHPSKLRVFSALMSDDLGAVTDSGAEVIEPLFQASQDINPAIASRARLGMVSLQNQEAIDFLCEWWSLTRHPFLGEVLAEGRFIAHLPTEARVLSALKLRERDVLVLAGDGIVPALVNACLDQDAEIATQAQLAVGEIVNPKIRNRLGDVLCAKWAETRHAVFEQLIVESKHVASEPLTARVLSALKTQQRTLIIDGPSEVAELLLAARKDFDSVIADQAAKALAELTDPESRRLVANTICEVWAQTRQSDVEEIIVRGRLIPDGPILIRMLSALKLRRRELITTAGEEIVLPLLDACTDVDNVIREEAKLAAAELVNATSRVSFANAICARWVETRDPRLEESMRYGGHVASTPIQTKVVSALKTDRRDLLVSLGPEVVSPLITATRDADETIQKQALLALGELTQKTTRECFANQLCKQWAQKRSKGLESLMVRGGYIATEPFDIAILSALKLGHREFIKGSADKLTKPLLQACMDEDLYISEQAGLAIGELESSQRETVINALCDEWIHSRAPRLEHIIKKGKYVATEPFSSRVLSALKTSQPKLITGLKEEVIGPLLAATEDTDKQIADLAQNALARLSKPVAREEVCRLVLHDDNPRARRAAIEGKYVPQDDYQRALFLFLTAQWERYDSFDFDRRFLLSVYETADQTLRNRIVKQLRASGRTDFLTILAGNDFRKRAGTMSSEEIDFLIKMLSRNREWGKLWGLVFDLPLMWSLNVVRLLDKQQWQPASELDRNLLQELIALATAEIVSSEQEFCRLLPPAVRRAGARVVSRANSVSFSPSEPIVAIGTNARKVVLWNFQRGRIEHVIDGFDRSIGRVVFMPDGTLVCAERTNDTLNTCTLRIWKNRKLSTLTRNTGSFTAVESIDQSHILIGGRDQSVELWDIATRRAITRCRFDIWARGLAVSSKRSEAALLYDGVTVISLPKMDVLASTYRGFWSGVVRCAAFAPDAKAIIAGKFNGEVVVLNRGGGALTLERKALFKHGGQVQSVAILKERSVVLSGCSNGKVQFTRWQNRAFVGAVEVPGERLTSLQVSGDGDFMVVGDTDASISFWDLRVLDIPMLFTLPLVNAVPNHLAAVTSAIEHRNMKQTIFRALKFIQLILRHRFRFDIEIDEVRSIRKGEYDIHIEG